MVPERAVEKRASLSVLHITLNKKGRHTPVLSTVKRKLPSGVLRIIRGARNRIVHYRNAAVQGPRFKSAIRRRLVGATASVMSGLSNFPRTVLLRLAKVAGARRAAFGRPRTLWAVTPILTLPLLARCDRLLGLNSQALVFTTYYITRDFDINLTHADRIAGRLGRTLWSQSHLFFRKLVLAYILVRYDVIHLFYDRGILLGPDRFGIDRHELDLYSATGKRLYTYAYGADVRAREPTLALGPINICTECPEPGKFCICNAIDLESSMKRLDGHATAKIAMGDMTAYVPDCRNMHYWPLDLTRFKVKPLPSRAGRPLRVAHAPNHPQFKGTRFLLTAIERLQREGHAIELVRVQGVPNDKVIELFESCDLVADQFVAGFHGYTALEAMALGRPVLCYLRGPAMTIDPDTCPIINTSPDTVFDVLLACLSGALDLEDLGRRSRRYVEHYYSLEAVAARLGHLYIETGTFPPSLTAKLAARIAELENGLPRQEPGPPPVQWNQMVEPA